MPRAAHRLAPLALLLALLLAALPAAPARAAAPRAVAPELSAALAPPSAAADGLAHGYVRGRDYTALNMSVAWAAGGLTSSVGDLGRFTEALMGGELLGPAALAALLDCAGTGGAWGIADMAYGLGVMRRALPAAGLAPPDRLALGHTGALGGYRSAVWHLPASGVTIVAVMTSYEADPGRLVSRALEALVAHGALPAGRAP